VSDRDFVAEALFDVALLGVHLSRMGEELVLWTSAEFNFASLGDEYTTGSSMLPQKKNSDVAELARAKAGRLIGNLTSLLVVLKGLPLSYNRDLQEDKEPLFDSIRQVRLVLAALTARTRRSSSTLTSPLPRRRTRIWSDRPRRRWLERRALSSGSRARGPTRRRGAVLEYRLWTPCKRATTSLASRPLEPGASLVHRSSPEPQDHSRGRSSVIV